MGWSCTVEQSKALEQLHEKEQAQAGYRDMQAGVVFTDGPQGGPYGKDYGTPGCLNMSLSTWQFIEPGKARKIGYTRIAPDGTVSMPKLARQQLGY